MQLHWKGKKRLEISLMTWTLLLMIQMRNFDDFVLTLRKQFWKRIFTKAILKYTFRRSIFHKRLNWLLIGMAVDWRINFSLHVIYSSIWHVWISILLNIKFADCCVIQANSWAGTMFRTTAWSPASLKVELAAPGKVFKRRKECMVKNT